MELLASEGIALLKLARASIESAFAGTSPALPEPSQGLTKKLGVFVTIKNTSGLRGCIGNITTPGPLAKTVVAMARAAAFEDPRFEPLDVTELERVTLEVTVLGPLRPVADRSNIIIGRDGLYICHRGKSAIFLPQVPIECRWDLSTYLRELCRKAGLSYECLTDPACRLYSFEGEVFLEAP